MLSFEVVGSSENASHTAVMIHGILGSGRNMKGFARRITQNFPAWSVVLVDLRNHGNSHGFASPHDLRACAQDIADLLERFHLRPKLLIGHSFGGKVALACSELVLVPRIWILDAPPGPVVFDPSDNSSVQNVISVLREIPLPLNSRQEVVEKLMARGISQSIASWMTTNVAQSEKGLAWAFDLDAVEEMLNSYAAVSFWPLLDSNPRAQRFDFVQAEKGDRFSRADLAHFAKLRQEDLIHLHTLKNSGHWVHIDNPEGLLDIMRPSFEAY